MIVGIQRKFIGVWFPELTLVLVAVVMRPGLDFSGIGGQGQETEKDYYWGHDCHLLSPTPCAAVRLRRFKLI
jgi:hypothetical protein